MRRKKIDVERVVMRDKRASHGAAGDGLHHRRFHFNKSARVQEAPQRLHQLAALEKDLAHIRIHYQVNIALAIAQFNVGQPMPFLRQRQKIFGEESDFFHVDVSSPVRVRNRYPLTPM